MTWERDEAPVVDDREEPLRFAVTDPGGRPDTLEPYMGMPGHLMLTRDDGAVFVHLHPVGTVSLASIETFALRQPGDIIRGQLGARLTALEKESGVHRQEPLPAPDSLSFHYAFPKP